MTIKVIINGAAGRMGQEAVKAVSEDKQFTLVAATGRQDDLAAKIKETHAEVVVDLTNAHSVYTNSKIIIENNAHPVIGSTGLTPAQISELQAICAQKKLGGIIVPNFSIGAVLMMRYAKDAAKYFNHAEIIEMHHDGKLDAPSGTALKTAQLIEENKKNAFQQTEKELLPGSRGAVYETTHIHAVRLPGLVAHQMVIFGGHFETLTIKHDSIHRAAFMPGLVLACKKVNALSTLFYGLEHLLD
jgi:4-hydroxy-tetrahydrodipicolinate reductase